MCVAQEEAEKYRRSLRIAVVYGGTPKGPQQRELTSGVEMVVATPGRLQDFMNTRITNVRRVTYLVLDEADKMLDMGLGPNVADICGNCPTDRQTLMFTATWSDEVQALSSRYLSKDSVKVKVSPPRPSQCARCGMDSWRLSGTVALVEYLRTTIKRESFPAPGCARTQGVKYHAGAKRNVYKENAKNICIHIFECLLHDTSPGKQEADGNKWQ